jgi:hypothetical protein
MKKCWQLNPKERPAFSQLAEMIEKHMDFFVSLDYLNMNEPTGENEQNEETIDPSLPYRLEIIKLFDEAAHS